MKSDENTTHKRLESTNLMFYAQSTNPLILRRRETDRQTDRQRGTERQRKRERDTHTE